MKTKPKFVGILSCSGEELPGGTVSRIATRKVLSDFLPDRTTTICVPLFLAGDEQEQEFVKKFPSITVDGCPKKCAARKVKALGKEPIDEFVIDEFFTDEELDKIKNGTRHDLDWEDHPYCIKLAEAIGHKVLKSQE